MINKCIFTLKEILPSENEVKHFKAGEFILVLAQKLDITEKVKLAAIKIWENIEKLNFVKSIHQVTLAACCLRFACALGEADDKDFDVIAGAAGITKMTLKNMYRELFPYRFYFITEECMIGNPQNLKNFWLSSQKDTKYSNQKRSLPENSYYHQEKAAKEYKQAVEKETVDRKELYFLETRYVVCKWCMD